MKKIIVLDREEKRMAAKWAADELWVQKKCYEDDNDYMLCVSDIIKSPVFKSMDNYIQHGTTTCKAHCIQVSYMSYCICRKCGWNYKAAARAGLLHDFFLYDWHTHARDTGNHFHGYTHPKTACDNAIKYFDIDAEEKNIILHHMWPLTPIPPKTGAGFAIVYADKFCGTVETAARIKNWCEYKFVPKHL